jgi:predicted house-cleaning noncanonical NTP pyrophosphatase (MazG superfamily)
MRRFHFAKLVRDKIVKGSLESGNNPVYRTLSDPEFLEELKKKLLEEALEVPQTQNPHELAKELADVQEVIDHLLKVLCLSKFQLKQLQRAKNRARGSFHKRQYIDYVDTRDDSRWIDYYLANPDKYPEIKD